MSDKKRNTFFHLIFCSRAKNSHFITRAPPHPSRTRDKTAVFSTRKKTEQIVILTCTKKHLAHLFFVNFLRPTLLYFPGNSAFFIAANMRMLINCCFSGLGLSNEKDFWICYWRVGNLAAHEILIL
jgi:hypothetical protein